jgi:mRNA interferase RelE/StbE
MYEVLLTREALRTYRRVDRPLLQKLNRCIQNLASNPHSHPNIKQLKGVLRGRFRYRVGDWRVVYQIDESEKRVTVLVIGHRSSAYD